MKIKLKPVKEIEVNENGDVTFNLSARASNADWIRAARLLKAGKLDEFEKLDETQMYYLVEDEE
jgi:hypothetical protein